MLEPDTKKDGHSYSACKSANLLSMIALSMISSSTSTSLTSLVLVLMATWMCFGQPHGPAYSQDGGMVLANQVQKRGHPYILIRPTPPLTRSSHACTDCDCTPALDFVGEVGASHIGPLRTRGGLLANPETAVQPLHFTVCPRVKPDLEAPRICQPAAAVECPDTVSPPWVATIGLLICDLWVASIAKEEESLHIQLIWNASTRMYLG
ncbi:hypothetical protein B0I35DRAFT_422165 [Stachybotrys elegans]|uniref:Uncharacterized protein n=1 Tax=Stachybotrys elegans TaxID=80388 RepID=A0A8K0WVI4_9HYPO|nr:hypothetical protein B0I35DRAFT_422165 [Stachybotrys elegans]